MFQSNHGVALLKEGFIYNMANKRLVDNIKTRWKLSRHRFEEKNTTSCMNIANEFTHTGHLEDRLRRI